VRVWAAVAAELHVIDLDPRDRELFVAAPRATLTPTFDEGGTMATDATTTVRERREPIVQEHVDAENRHDGEATLATFEDRSQVACLDPLSAPPSTPKTRS
jgi:hypothetical protein